MQTSIGADPQDESAVYKLEYREGSADEHHQCLISGGSRLTAVMNAFTSYLRSDQEWKASFEWTKVNRMELIVNGSAVSQTPDDSLIEWCLKNLLRFDALERFVILVNCRRSEEHYMQTWVDTGSQDKDTVYTLEYREGSADEHYQCFISGPSGLTAATKAFTSFLHSDQEWKVSFKWNKLDGLEG